MATEGAFRDEAQTRIQLIDPALHARGWSEDLIRREETLGTVEIVDGRPRRNTIGRTDYTLRVRPKPGDQPVAVAVLEAKSEGRHPAYGLDQAKGYLACRRLHVPFVAATNGHQWVLFDSRTGVTSQTRPMADFPTPQELQTLYEDAVGLTLDHELARPLLKPYRGGEASRRYYQDAAIRAALEKIARGDKRVLLSLATGSGKTWIAVNLLRRIADAGQLRRALFVVDRDELRAQALNALQNAFGNDAAAASGRNPEKNARIVVATYQTLGVDSDDADATFLEASYPPDYFSHIVIDECHRSAWGKWSEVLTRNPNAVQIGLTATPRTLDYGRSAPALADEQITADNLRHFGEPVYEYEIGQGIEDGYLAACEIVRRDIFLEGSPFAERETGLERDDLWSAGAAVADARTGELLSAGEARERYDAGSFEAKIMLPDRVEAMAADLLANLLATGGPEQKTIVFCARDAHADAVAIALNNRYAAWCAGQGRKPAAPYAFKCTAASEGGQYLADLRGASRSHFVATTVDLLTTGVDVPGVRNVVFFKYVRSPIAFYQMLGRGTRLDPPTGKLMFRVYDYTAATRLLGEAFRTRATSERTEPSAEAPEAEAERVLTVQGIDVRVEPAGVAIVTTVDGVARAVSLEEYKERVASSLLARAATLEDFRAAWVAPALRHDLVAALPDGGRSAPLIRKVEALEDFDLYDVLAELAYGLEGKTRAARAAAFDYKAAAWLASLPEATAATLRALARQFARAGTEEMENPGVLKTPEVVTAGGLAALKVVGSAAEILRATKERLFAA